MKHKAKSAGSTSPSKTGKGGQKGKGKSGVSSGGASTSGSSFDLKDVPLSFPDFVSSETEHEAWVPRYHAVARRAESDGVGMEDMDTLQLELEAMLAAVVVKKTTIKEELGVLQSLEKYKGSGSSGKRGASSPVRRGGIPSVATNKDSIKRFKNSSGKPVESGKVLGGMPKIKSDQSLPSFDPLQNEQIRPLSDTSKPNLPKNETPNRFWAFVEPYCAPITPDDIKLLEDLIKSHNDMSEYHRIPPLGQHYTQRWAKEDLENERMKSAGAAVNSAGGEDVKPGEEVKAAAGKMLKKAEATGGADETPYGELTTRLVAGLMEEKFMTPVEESIDACKNKNGSSGTSEADDSKSNLIKSLNIGNAEALESRVRKELEDQGILDPNDNDEENGEEENDEILEELKRCQNELRSVSAHNLTQLKRLLKAAKEEMVRQELRNKLAKADAEVMDAYSKISSARSKKKVPGKKEREMAWKALKEREIILKELESL